MNRTDTATRIEASNGAGFRPYVAPKLTMPEFTWQAIIAGTAPGVIELRFVHDSTCGSRRGRAQAPVTCRL